MLNCTNCHKPLPNRAVNTFSLVECPSCSVSMRIDAYPAINKSIEVGRTGEALQMDKEAGCFYHPGKKATVPCSICGRFLCALCDVPLNGDHLCPACFEKGRTKKKIKNLENQRTCYDTIALLLAIFPMLFYWFTIITAPVVIYLTVRHWKTPSSIVRRSKIRFILAFFFAGLQIAGWILFFSGIFLSA